MSIQQISALARGLKQADTTDLRVRSASLARFDELRTLLQRAGCTELVHCLEAATELTKMTMVETPPTTAQLMDVVSTLVEAVDAAFQYENPHTVKARQMSSGLTLATPGGEGPTGSTPAANGAANTASSPAASGTTPAPAKGPTLSMPKPGEGGANLSLSGPKPKATPPPKPAANGSEARPQSVPRRTVANTGPTEGPAQKQEGALPLLNDMIFGELMIQLGHINREELNGALDHQAAHGGRLGQSLIDTNATSWDVIENVLRFQRMLNPDQAESPEQDESKEAHPKAHREMPSLLGEVVVHLGFTEPERVQEALRVHKASGIRMGEALVQIGALTWPQLRESLRVQHNVRYAAGHAEVNTPKFGLPATGGKKLKLG